MEFKTDMLLHGGDYNPEQWLKRPDILEKDIDMLSQSGCNVVSLGIFSWVTLEPEEGVFNFGWLQEIIDKLYKSGIYTILATPSGARPKWMADKYPEVLRVDETRHRNLFGFRHNHCYTSPVYREKVHIINKKLAEEVATHPGVILWHISNEYGGECHCPLCQDAFRKWLKEKYQTIENLNDQWCTTFWSHNYNSFDQIESPSRIGETQLHALNLDWKRFVTHQTADFLHHEIQAVRDGGSNLPTTANLMYHYKGLDYFKITKEIDVVSWDTYPTWHKEDAIDTADDNGLYHDLMRSLKGKPFIQMESCPAATNWQGVSKLKKPGVLFAQSMEAIAHGSEGALYFQIRQSRGASEKFHGAVIDHYGGKDTRVFKEVSETGEALKKIKELAGTIVNSKAAIIYDWEENRLVPVHNNALGLNRTYTCKYLCDLVELRGARSLMTYGEDFYKGYSCLTVNDYGKGKAWYVAADADRDFYDDFIGKVVADSDISCGIKGEIPDTLEITVRENDDAKYYIYQNFGTDAVELPLPDGEAEWIYGSGEERLKIYGLAVAKIKIV